MIINRIFISVLLHGALGLNHHYVMPSSSASVLCPGQPCLTLDQFTEMTEKYFTTGSTFVFLAGNHSLGTELSLTNVSNITLRGKGDASIILGNNVAIFCEIVDNIRIEGLTLKLCKHQCVWPSALYLLDSFDIVISNSIFHGSRKDIANAIYSHHSNFTVLNSLFEGNTGYKGGAIESWNGSVMTIAGSTFVGNRGKLGGAISVIDSVILLQGNPVNKFMHNVATSSGGALVCQSCSLTLTGNNRFNNNTCSNNIDGTGGAVSVYWGKITFSLSSAAFSGNEAYIGGAINLWKSVLSCGSPSMVILDRNKARFGGALHVSCSLLQMRECFLNIASNFAETAGGGVYISDGTNGESELSGNFTNNTAKDVGGAVYIQNECNITLRYVNMTGNSATALYVIDSRVTLRKTRWIKNNGDKVGGAIASQHSILLFEDYTFFEGNKASNGGAMYLLQGTASFVGISRFMNNTALKLGGALYSTGVSSFKISGPVEFMFNHAQNGGAVFLHSGVSVMMVANGYFNFSSNTASSYGGGMFYDDNTSPGQCLYSPDEAHPYCFIQVDDVDIPKQTLFTNADSAGVDGNFLYGGLLDRCELRINHNSTSILSFLINGYDSNRNLLVSSDPYALCLCYNQTLDCTTKLSITEIHRGQKFSIPLVAIAQGNTVTPSSVMATLSSTANLKLEQNTQHLPPYCSILTYNVYSTDESEFVTLYPEGPCHDTGHARVELYFTLLPCPDGFMLASNGRCVCEERLHKYNVSCTIDEDIQLRKKAGSGFWMGAEYRDGSYEGLILYKTCPIEYCRTDEVNMTLPDLYIQCAEGRTGLLCGGCADNYSLSIGSSTCRECSNNYLALILPFAAAGVALVVFLSMLRLTVATGMINSLILYANIVQVNRKLFFPANTVNILTVFIAWLNLDLGFDTCFYNRMDAFAQTCLQFAFPAYVWVLISLIILTSRYSITVSKLIGHNPVAVLATLLLMSYTKVLKIIIEVYSSVKLDYPQNGTDRAVWLKDANVPYLQSRHLALTVVTSLFLVFLFLPYTLLLLLGHKLYHLSGRKYFHWFNRMKPLLDSYYAPYKIHTRYWTGFLLLVRCALYIVFSFNSLGGTHESLLAIIITFTALGFAAGFVYQGRIYKNTGVNILEALAYLNLVTLSALTLARVPHLTALVYSLVAVVFATLVVVVAYHFHTLYTAKSAMWSILRVCLFRNRRNPAKLDPPVVNAKNSSVDPHKIVSKTVIDLREPLLED